MDESRVRDKSEGDHVSKWRLKEYGSGKEGDVASDLRSRAEGDRKGDGDRGTDRS